MNNLILQVKNVLYNINTMFLSIFGVNSNLARTLMIFIIIDYITGVIKAIITKNISSEIGGRGITKKISIFIIVCMSVLLSRYVLNDNQIFSNVIIFFYIGNEGISIIENLSAIGVPIPKKLKNILKEFNDK